MTAKHIGKYSILKKALFFAVCVGILTLALFSVCTSQKANAQDSQDFNETNRMFSWTIKGSGGDGLYADNTTDLHPEFYKSHISWGSEVNDICSYLHPDSLLSYYLTHPTFECFVYQDYFKDENTGKEYNGLNIVFDWYNPDTHLVSFSFYQPSDKFTSWTFSTNEATGYEQVPTLRPGKNITEYIFGNAYFKATDDVGIDVSGFVVDAYNSLRPVSGAFVQYYQRTLWGDIPIPNMSTYTDRFGHYKLSGVDKNIMPGVVKVFKYGYEVGESWNIWGAPEGEDTVYRFIQMTPLWLQYPALSSPPEPPIIPIPAQQDAPKPVSYSFFSTWF